MKHVHIVLEDEEVERLETVKGSASWKALLMKVLESSEGSICFGR